MNEKIKTARLSIISNTSLIVMKLLAGLFSGSVSILSEAIHSGMDLLAAVIAFISVKMSDSPPDEKHPYGHGKFENVSGVIEAVLIFIAAGWIIYEAIHKIIKPNAIENIEIGALVMAVSALVNFFVSRKLYKVAKKTESIASGCPAFENRCVYLHWCCCWVIPDMAYRLALSRSHCGY
jgi:cation diffusion facilitator family transporter